jgi:hypothetical protein
MNQNNKAMQAMPKMQTEQDKKELTQTILARRAFDNAGGGMFILEQIALGKKHTEIAKKHKTTVMQLNAYLKATCTADEIELANISQIMTRADELDDKAEDIEDPKKRHDAKFELLEWQANAETQKYKKKITADVGQGITIAFDLASLLQPSKPQPVTIENAEVVNG